VDFARSLIQHNREFCDFIRNGVPVEWRDAGGETKYARARVIDFRNDTGPDGTPNNRFLAVRELKIQGLRVPHYNRRADLVCFVNGLPLVFIELKAVYVNMRAGFDNNLTDYLSETSINHAFHHNAFLVVSNGARANRVYPGKACGVIVDYNREKDRVTIEETFGRLVDFTKSLDAEQKRAAEEGLSQDEYALFQMLFKDSISRADRERLKLASRDLLTALKTHLQPMPNWTKNTQTQADVKMFILDNLYASLPRPPFSDEETDSLADRVYDLVWQRSAAGAMFAAA